MVAVGVGVVVVVVVAVVVAVGVGVVVGVAVVVVVRRLYLLVPASWWPALDEAAARRGLTSRADYVRQVVLAALRADLGRDP